MTMIVETSDGMRLDRGSIPLISICLKKARVIDARVFFVEFLFSKMKEFSNICNDKLERAV
ncbi:hypothetical protein LDI10_02990 [Lactobacillus delbrueckii subsp. indicus]|nr:hypothetical protein LDI10_02990 [Lactobacillus delbrueckii subsp. indicus]